MARCRCCTCLLKDAVHTPHSIRTGVGARTLMVAAALQASIHGGHTPEAFTFFEGDQFPICLHFGTESLYEKSHCRKYLPTLRRVLSMCCGCIVSSTWQCTQAALACADVRGVAPPTRSASRLHRARQAQFNRDFITVSTLLSLPCLGPLPYRHLYIECAHSHQPCAKMSYTCSGGG